MAMSVVYTTVNGQILSESRGGTVSHFVPDPLGSVVMVRDTSGNTVYEAEYDPYGNVQSETGTNPSPLGYVGTLGYIKDSAASMYVRARYLLNNLGRWLTKDPLWPDEPGYVYAGAAPSLWVDPSGLSTYIGLPPSLFCPLREKGFNWAACDATARGGCPNQGKSGGMIDLNKFNRGGSPGSIDTCDPKNVDRDAINQRLFELRNIRNQLCSGDLNAPPGGGGGGSYQHWVETRPCFYYDGTSNRVGCRIYCKSSLMANLRRYFKGGEQSNGIGCMACCLMAHENFHCLQIYIGARGQTNAVECAAFDHEIKCLESVLAGKKCS